MSITGTRVGAFVAGTASRTGSKWLERLQAHQQHLEDELRNVQELIERLGPGPQQTANI